MEAPQTPGTADKLASNLRKGVLESCVLALLAGREMYGLEPPTSWPPGTSALVPAASTRCWAGCVTPASS